MQPHSQPIRILVLGQSHNFPVDHAGGHDGFVRLLQEGHIAAYDHMSALDLAQRFGWQGMWSEVKHKVQEMNANVLFLRFFHHPQATDPTAGLLAIKQLPHKPMIITSLGDPFGRWFNTMPRSFIAAAKLADLTTLTGMGYLAGQLQAQGAKNLVLMPNGICQIRFQFVPETNLNPQFDVVFVGSRVHARNPLGHYFWTSRNRTRFVDALARRYGRKFGLFGKGWNGYDCCQGEIKYADQHQTYRRGRVAVGGMPNGYHNYYMSDRVVIGLGSGVPFVDFHIPGVEKIFPDGQAWWLAHSLPDYINKIDHLLNRDPVQLSKQSHATAHNIFSQHTSYHRTLNTINITRNLLSARAEGTSAALPALEYLPEPRIYDTDKLPIIVNWQG